MNDPAIRVLGRIVFARARFADGRPAVNIADLMFPDPSERHRLVALGAGLQLAGSPPWMAAHNLPGIPFGSAVAATLPRPIIEEVMRGDGGRAFTDLEVKDFLRPVLDAVATGQRILAGVAAPPSADPAYTRISPVMLPYWRFIAGDDRAEPVIGGALEYLALRVFTAAEFSFVDRCGGRLRPMPAKEAEKGNVLPRRRGRPQKHDWAALMAALAVKLSEEGLPGPGEQAEFERWAATSMSTQAAESEIRVYVSKAIEAHRKNVG